jgi:hypothetical protein
MSWFPRSDGASWALHRQLYILEQAKRVVDRSMGVACRHGVADAEQLELAFGVPDNRRRFAAYELDVSNEADG